MRCHRCDNALLSTDAEGASVYRCAGCKGFWLPADRLRALQDDHPFDPEAFFVQLRDGTRGISACRCPCCTTSMNESSIQTVQLEWCAVCEGVWFDRGELERLVTAKGGVLRSREAKDAVLDLANALFTFLS